LDGAENRVSPVSPMSQTRILRTLVAGTLVALLTLSAAPLGASTHTNCSLTYKTVNAGGQTFYVVTYNGISCIGGELWLECNGIVDWQHDTTPKLLNLDCDFDADQQLF
jgi:hypothetical protein